MGPRVRFNYFLAATASLLLVASVFVLTSGGEKLPTLWDELDSDPNDDGESGESSNLGSFHILSEIHLDDKSSYLLEEWHDGPSQAFRLDLLAQHEEKSDGGGGTAQTQGALANIAKRSILIRGATSERYLFGPFKCLPFENVNWAFGANLGRKLAPAAAATSRSSSPLAIAGLGSIWLYASAQASARVTFKKAFMPLDGTLQNKRSRARTMRTFDQFVVKPDARFAYTIKFHFLPDEWKRADGKFNPDALIAVHLVDSIQQASDSQGNSSSSTLRSGALPRVRLAARIIRMETGSRAAESIFNTNKSHKENLFELPLGYGCVRSASSTTASIETQRSAYKPPRNCIPAHYKSSSSSGSGSGKQVSSGQMSSGAQICNIDVVGYFPNHLNDELDKWTVHTSSLRLVSGALQNRNYLTLEKRDFSTTKQLTSSNGVRLQKSRVRRSKRIWDLGLQSEGEQQQQLEQLEDSEYASQTYAERKSTPSLPMYFELSERLRVCHAHGNARLDELANLELLVPVSGRSTNNRTTGGELYQLVGLSLIDEQTIERFFLETDGFHLVRELASPWAKYRTFYHEKRIDHFEMRQSSASAVSSAAAAASVGPVIWSGPISLVRRWNYFDSSRRTGGAANLISSLQDKTRQTQIPAEALNVQLTIYLFDSSAYERQVGRIQLTMETGQPANVAYLHRELNIEPCLQRRPADNLHLHTPIVDLDPWRRRQLDNIAFNLLYPLDLPLTTSALSLQADYQDKIYEKFLEIMQKKVLQTEEDEAEQQQQQLEFNLMQLRELNIDIESDSITISGTICKWPEIFNYIKWPARKTSSETFNQVRVFTSELKATIEQCATSCSHYNCALFVYDQLTKNCHLYQEGVGSSQEVTFVNRTENKSIGSSGKTNFARFNVYESIYERRASSFKNKQPATPSQMVERMRALLAHQLGDQNPDETDESGAPSPLTIQIDEIDTGRRLILAPSSMRTGSDLSKKAQLLVNGNGNGKGGGGGGVNKENWNAENFLDTSEQDDGRVTIESEFELLYKNRKFKADNFAHSSSNFNEQFPLQEASSIQDEWQCEQLCREHDCRSFSYCSLSQKCLISKLHTTSSIEAASDEASFCSLLALEYMSKFDKFKGLIGNEEALERFQEAPKPSERRRALSLDSARDCAIACMDLNEFTCRSFIFCKGKSDNCLMFGERRRALDRRLGRQGVSLKNGPNASATHETANRPASRCDLYQRSFLADYKQFYGKQLRQPLDANGAPSGSKSIRLVMGLGAEDCASVCSQAIDEGERESTCGAFHVCLANSKRGKHRNRLLCGLLMLSLDNNENNPNEGDLLQDASNCSSFVSESQSKTSKERKGTSSNRGGGQPMVDSLLSDERVKTTNMNFVLGFSLTIIGLLLGYSLAWLVTIKRWQIHFLP